MRCPFCEASETKVIDSRASREGAVVRRRRECEQCKGRFTTYEKFEEFLPMVVKKDARRETFDRQKILRGLQRACEKRPITGETIETIADTVEKELVQRHEKEINSRMIGEILMKHLRLIDDVAYVRFVSVYREFRDIHEFLTELETLQNSESRVEKHDT